MPDTASLRVGEAVAYRAELSFPDGSSQPASNVAWSLSGSGASIDGGNVVGLNLGEVTLSAFAAGQSSSRALSVVPDLIGSWTGKMYVPTCIKVSGGGPYYCTKTPNGWDWKLTGGIQEQTGSRFVISATTDSPHETPGVSEGQISALGEFEIAETTLRLTDGEWTMVFTHWRGSSGVAPDGTRTMTGTLTVDESFVSSLFGPQHYRNNATFQFTRIK